MDVKTDRTEQMCGGDLSLCWGTFSLCVVLMNVADFSAKMGSVMRKFVFGHMQTMKSDQSLHWLQTESLNTVDCFNSKQIPG